jgi:hypothetical protein
MSNESTEMVRAETGTIVRQEFGADQLARSAETSQTAMAEQARAEVEARFVMAVKRPRHEGDARDRILKSCDRPGFAQSAIYKKPIGGNKQPIEGLSIRFAEEVARAWRNIHISVTILSDDAEKRILRVTATDLEANLSEDLPVIVEKTIERKFLKAGEVAIRTRVNAYGDLVHLLPADEGRLLTKQAAEIAKAKRQAVIHLIPADVLEEARSACYKTMDKEDARDPDAAKKQLFDSFSGIGVRPSELEKYIGHELSAVSPAELTELRFVFVGVRDGEHTWAEALATKVAPVEGKPDPKVVALKDKIANKAKAAAEARKGAGKKAPQPAHDAETGEVREPGAEG